MFHISPGHTKPLSAFAVDATAGTLPAVAFIDPSIGEDQLINGSNYETDEHPPADIRAGEYFVSQVVTALRNSPSWNDSVLFWTYDEHGGYYDHVKPAPAPQNGARTPDGIFPGQCADESNPPASEQPGGGATCNHSKTVDAPGICPDFTPTGPYPADCAAFDQLGFRVPFAAVSPFSKPHYVSHVVSSHTSFLALIRKRFSLPSLTIRDANSNDLEDLFDFDNSPSLNAAVALAPRSNRRHRCRATPGVRSDGAHLESLDVRRPKRGATGGIQPPMESPRMRTPRITSFAAGINSGAILSERTPSRRSSGMSSSRPASSPHTVIGMPSASVMAIARRRRTVAWVSS
jgi:hypothetical protein